MEAQKPTVGKFAMNYGVILGVIMILIGVFSYVTGMAIKLVQWPQWLYYIIFPIVIFYAISQFKKQNANVLSLGEAIKLGLVIAVISAIIYAIYVLLFNYVIDPEFMGLMKEAVMDKMLENNTAQEIIDQQMKAMEFLMNPITGSALWIGLSMFFGLIYSLIGGLVMKKD